MGKGKTPPGSRKKVTKSHTTCIPLAESVLKGINRLSIVDKIALGVIKPNLRAGGRRLKILIENDRVLLLKLRDTNSYQELRIYTNDPTGVTTSLVAMAGKNAWGITQ